MQVLNLHVVYLRCTHKHCAEACNFTKSNTPPGVFFTFFKYTNDTKLHNASHIYFSNSLLYIFIYAHEYEKTWYF